MAESNLLGSKRRILFLREYLEEHTDDDHFVTTDEVIRLYEKNGYRATRQTVSDDVEVLNASGIEVIVNQIAHNKTKTNAYHIGTRLFELPELKILVDAVSSSRFITAEKSELLIKKLSRMTNCENREDLVARIYMDQRLKSTDPNLFVNVDTIHKAIREKKKISFHYRDYAPNKEKILRNNGEVYISSPYAMIWNDDRYYVPCYSDKHSKIVNYRIDRMCDVSILNEEAYTDPDFNVAEYSRKVIKLYDGNLAECEVSLCCMNNHMRHVLDRFGENTRTEIINRNYFRARINIVPSNTFFAWVFQYKDGILIEKPRDVRKRYEETLSLILEKQNVFENK